MPQDIFMCNYLKHCLIVLYVLLKIVRMALNMINQMCSLRSMNVFISEAIKKKVLNMDYWIPINGTKVFFGLANRQK